LARQRTPSENELDREPQGGDPHDPANINPRLLLWVSELIDAREEMPISEQIRAIAAIGRLQINMIKLREDSGGGHQSGTEVKRFAKAFAANATNKRKKLARSTAAIAGPDDDDLEY
jgi:hypothetical protein